MTGAKIRLAIAAVLFVGWLCWLAYLVVTKNDPVVVSRSQMMAATHFVVANVAVDAQGRPETKVAVVRDLHPVGAPLAGTITVANIKDARIGGASDFTAGGPFLLPLTAIPNSNSYDLTPPPRSPGNEGALRPRPWAYRWDAPGVQRQFDELIAHRP
jgi:hypothetical protein